MNTQYWMENELTHDQAQLNKRRARRERDGQILLRHLDGIPQSAIAAEFKLTQGRVSQIIKALRSVGGAS